MPIRHRVNKKRQYITVIVESKPSAGDVAAWINKRNYDSETNGFRRLVLVSERVATMSLSEINELAKAVNDLAPADGPRCAIVAFTDVQFGQCRVYLSYRDTNPENLRVFRDIREALNWLGLDLNPAILEFEMAIALS